MNNIDQATDSSAWKDISPEAVQLVTSEMKKREVIPEDSEPDAVEIANRLCLTHEGSLTLAGALLLCKRPDRFLEGTYVRIGLFDSDGSLLDEDMLKVPLLLQPHISVRKLFKKYIESRIVYGNLYLDAVYDYPMKAVEEAITNACVHRDLSSGCPVEIRVHPDHMTITNDGGLPEGWTVSDLLYEHRSRPRNTRIADAFHDAGLMGCWGKGIENMMSECT